jgi:hypothetical protein
MWLHGTHAYAAHGTAGDVMQTPYAYLIIHFTYSAIDTNHICNHTWCHTIFSHYGSKQSIFFSKHVPRGSIRAMKVGDEAKIHCAGLTFVIRVGFENYYAIQICSTKLKVYNE